MRAKGEEILLSVCIKDQIQNMNLVIGCTVGCDYCYAWNNVRRWHMIAVQHHHCGADLVGVFQDGLVDMQSEGREVFRKH